MQISILLLFLLGLGVSFLLSGMEAGVFALSPIRIRQQRRAGNPRAAVLHRFLETPENFLWTIFVGNIVANLAVFTIGVASLYFWLGTMPWLFLVCLAAGVIMFYVLFELFPKMLFRLYPNRLCMALVLPFRLVHWVLKPLVGLMALFSRSFLAWSGGRRFTRRIFGTRDELRMVMQESGQTITSDEKAMINRVLDLQNRTVRQVMVPLSQTTTVSMDSTVAVLLALSRESGHSRIPAWEEKQAHRRIGGVVSVRQILYENNLDQSRKVAEFIKPAIYLNEDMRLETALRRMQRSGQRLAIVLAADRTEIGIISLQDIMKVIFGEVSL
ncbi:MAG TPA: CNNM domain-containing protein [Candidatus Saccharimonadales bacterium]|nr:CNNM domain-containing protein [Candidatus Saccharimonadales bacterium]